MRREVSEKSCSLQVIEMRGQLHEPIQDSEQIGLELSVSDYVSTQIKVGRVSHSRVHLALKDVLISFESGEHEGIQRLMLLRYTEEIIQDRTGLRP